MIVLPNGLSVVPCVCEREGEREGERTRESKRKSERERERAREYRMCVCVKEQRCEQEQVIHIWGGNDSWAP